jgi:hypothetical protein
MSGGEMRGGGSPDFALFALIRGYSLTVYARRLIRISAINARVTTRFAGEPIGPSSRTS